MSVLLGAIALSLLRKLSFFPPFQTERREDGRRLLVVADVAAGERGNRFGASTSGLWSASRSSGRTSRSLVGPFHKPAFVGNVFFVILLHFVSGSTAEDQPEQ